jgi:hypothetical protein
MKTTLAWGARVPAAFRAAVRAIADDLGAEANDLMSVMAFETGRSFSASVRNAAGSGAVGLIQFMPSTAAALGTSIEALAAMSPQAQLQFVHAYFRPWRGRLRGLGDVYGAVLWPGMIGRPDSHVVFDRADPRHPARYLQNRGLDLDKDGRVTRGEICARILATREEGLRPENLAAD